PSLFTPAGAGSRAPHAQPLILVCFPGGPACRYFPAAQAVPDQCTAQPARQKIAFTHPEGQPVSFVSWCLLRLAASGNGHFTAVFCLADPAGISAGVFRASNVRSLRHPGGATQKPAAPAGA